jgi:uncharacterized protein/uncharacterized tellurite resistance protein B-like protein
VVKDSDAAMILYRLGLLCAATTLAALPALSIAASFNCGKARSTTEILICADPQLSALDDDLAVLYRSAKAAATDGMAFKKETNEEWKRRGKCQDRDCLIQWYKRRSSQLATTLNHAQQQTTPSAAAAVSPVPTPPTPAETPRPDDSPSVGGLILFVGAVFIALWFIQRVRDGKRRLVARPAATVSASGPPEIILTRKAASSRRLANTMQFEVHVSAGSQESTPKSAGKELPTVWVRPGQSVTVQGLCLSGGMLYVGNTLMASDGGIEPAQIDPTLEVDPQPADPSERLFGYWARYESISPPARRAFLTWLAGGRCDPNANIGNVFLFFYGLERRLLVDALNDPAAKAEAPTMAAEIERLRSIYDDSSFLRYSSDLLDFLAADDVEPELSLKPPPPSTASRGMSLRLRIGLGQAAVDARPVSAEWALAWARSEPNVRLPGVARRCARQFDAQFVRSYAEKFGAGLKLSVNRTKLKIAYRPASGGLLNQSFVANLGDLPDVTTIVTPLKKLQVVVDEVATSLDAYSRFIGRHADKTASLEATLLLPKALWSSSVQFAFDAIDKRIGMGMVVIKLGELLGGTSSLTRDTLKNLFHVLHNQNVGVEPDVLAGAKTPKSEAAVVLFRLSADGHGNRADNRAGYDAVAVMLDLAITLANADGRVSGREVQFLNRQVDAWSHVGAAAQRRLRARLRLGIVYPPSLSSLKSRLEPLPVAARTGLAKLLSALALADGRLAPAAVKHLEKVYQHLGIESTALYSELHVASVATDAKVAAIPAHLTEIQATPNVVRTSDLATKAKVTARGLLLNAGRIAALQVESERVTALLAKVFEEQELQEPVAAAPAANADEQDGQEEASRLLGLDSEHSTFLRALLTRSRWSRAELVDMAADMELMLDGALERVNEAALDTFDSRVAEGDDPIEIAQDLMESVSA